MSPKEIDALAKKIADRQEAYKRPVLPLELAIQYAGKRSESAFYRWCEKWNVVPCDTGRFSRTRLDQALNQESKRRKVS